MVAGSAWLVSCWIGLHVIALLIAWATRIAAGSCVENLAHLGFFAAMAAVGATAWVCQQVGVGWTWSAITLIAMVLTAVIDFRRVSEPAHASIGG